MSRERGGVLCSDSRPSPCSHIAYTVRSSALRARQSHGYPTRKQSLCIKLGTRSTSVAFLLWKATSTSNEAVIDADFLEELNAVSNKTLQVLSSGSEDDAWTLATELRELRTYLEGEKDIKSSRFLRVMEGLLAHTVLKEASQLDGMYQRALDTILNQVAGAPWRLVEEGKSAEVSDEDGFSTWDDVFSGKKAGSSNTQQEVGEAGEEPVSLESTNAFYRLLGVATYADQAEIKLAYRKLALQLHPDVNDAVDATERFAELSNVYDVLSDPTSRELYDSFGTAGLKAQQTPPAGRGNAYKAWEEFKPYKRENKRTRARDATRANSNSEASCSGDEYEAGRGGEPQMGDVVEYPLRSIETEDFADGRSHGVGLIVGRNVDRGDAAKLPPEQLPICEIEPLRQEEPGSDRWMPDELGISSFARLEEMRVIPVAAFNNRHDVWTITAPLSDGCGGPPLPEEVIL